MGILGVAWVVVLVLKFFGLIGIGWFWAIIWPIPVILALWLIFMLFGVTLVGLGSLTRK